MDEEAQPPERGLAVDAGDDVVGEGDGLDGGGEAEQAGLDDEGLVGFDSDEIGEVIDGEADVDEGAVGDAEDSRRSV